MEHMRDNLYTVHIEFHFLRQVLTPAQSVIINHRIQVSNYEIVSFSRVFEFNILPRNCQKSYHQIIFRMYSLLDRLL